MNLRWTLIGFVCACIAAYCIGDLLGRIATPKDSKPECIFIAGLLTAEQIAEGMTQQLKQGNCNSVRLVR